MYLPAVQHASFSRDNRPFPIDLHCSCLRAVHVRTYRRPLIAEWSEDRSASVVKLSRSAATWASVRGFVHAYGSDSKNTRGCCYHEDTGDRLWDLTRSRSERERWKEFFKSLHAERACVCLRSETPRSLWIPYMWYMSFPRVLSRYRDAERVEPAAASRPGIRRRFVSPKTSASERGSLLTGSRALALLHLALRSCAAVKLSWHEKSLALHRYMRWRCVCVWEIPSGCEYCRAIVSDL